MCGGFSWSKNALIALNILYIVIGSLMIGVTVYGGASTIVGNLPIVNGILACGVILILISVLGLVGAVKHHQVMLFFYMIILFLLVVIQFVISLVCIGIKPHQEVQYAQQGWSMAPMETQQKVQEDFLCCGFNSTMIDNHPSCATVNDKCCAVGAPEGCQCPPCNPKLESSIRYAFHLSGSIGLFFSFTEMIAVLITRRYRNQQDPDHLPARAIFPQSNYVY